MKELNKERFLNSFFDFVKIPSESPNDQEFIAYLKDLFTKEGATCELDSYGNLLAHFPAKNSSSTDVIAFSAHADTVKPGVGIEPVIEGDRVVSKGDTILGADDKGGIAEMLEALRIADKYPPIDFIINRCEEIGTLGSKNLDFSKTKAKMGFVVDLEAPSEVVVGGPTHIFFDVTYTGKSAHAGMAPEEGISTIEAASHAISKIKWGRIDNETTSNVGTIKGGAIRNGIPEHCELLAECRSLNHDKAMKLAEDIKAAFQYGADKVGAKVKIDMEVSSEAYEIKESEEVVQVVKRALVKQGITPDVQIITGGTDATSFNLNGIPTAAIAVACYDIHTVDEYLVISEAEAITKTLATIMEDLA